MELPGRSSGAGAHGVYHGSDRCPICVVPPMAPHLNSCDYEGVWRGEFSDGFREDDDEDYEDD